MFENLDFGKNFRKMSILVNIFKNNDFGENFRKISSLLKILEKSWFW